MVNISMMLEGAAPTLKLCRPIAMPDVLRNHKSKQASGRHSPVGEDLADLVDVHDAGEGREPCGTQNTKKREKLSETQSTGRARAGRGERHGE